MTRYLSQEDFFDNYFDVFDEGISPSPENLELVRGFLLKKWRERAVENGASTSDLPSDLTDSCKFTALFGSVVFSADIAGNWNHVYNVVDGKIVDINAGATDVAGKSDIHIHDPGFICGGEFRDSAMTCVRRVAAWLAEFSAIYESLPIPSTTISPISGPHM